MKKVMFLIIFLVFIFYNIDINATNLKKIDLKLKENETNIVFIKLKESSSILITNDEESNLFILDYKSDKNLKETLNIFEIKPNIHFLKNKVDQTFGNVYVFKNEENLKFRVNNYTLCIFTKNQTNICDFLYIKQLKEEIKDIDKFSAIFYDEQIKDEYLKNLQESWLDSAIVSINSFTILKLYEDSYNILVVPSTNN